MALTVAEAIAIHDVLRKLVPDAFRESLASQRYVDAAALLAEAANRKLLCGPTGEDIRNAWGKR